MTTTSWPIYTVDEIRQGILDSYTVYRPDDSTDDGSDAWVEANAIAIQLFRLQARDAEVASWISILFATEEHLDAHAVIWLGAANARKGATKWIGKIQLQATSGTPFVPAGQTGTHAAGASYKTLADIDAIDWSGGYATVAAESVTTGTAANQADGAAITLSSPPAGVSSTATLVVDADTVLGANRELDGPLRLRVLNATQNRPASGNWAHFREWAESVEGVDVAFVYPRFYGITTTLIVPMGPAGARVISDDTKTAVEAAIEAARPGGSIPTVLKVAESAVSVEVEITPSAGSEPDWTGSLTTAAGCSVTTVVCTTDPALDGVEAGVRIVAPVTISGKRTTQQRVVESVDTPTKTITVTEAFDAVPGATENVTPGGPAWQPAYDAIAACFDALGPARSTDPEAPRWPSWVGAYTSRLFLSDIYHAVDAATGVAGCTVVSPAANQDPTVDPHDTTIPLLVLDPEILITWST
jgi:uncharacterized phage protein gp47/JayE